MENNNNWCTSCFGHKKKPEKPTKRHIKGGPKWKQLSGESNWEGLTNPLDLDLRKTIIRYGEMAQSTYDAFNTEKASKYAGDSLYGRKTFFSKVGLEKGNPYKYRVTKFLYATSKIDVPEAFILKPVSREAWSKESNWIGFVGVVSDEAKEVVGRRDIVIAWRGTVRTLEWVNDFEFGFVSADKVFGDGSDVKVHQGWYSIYTSDDSRSPFNKTSARDQVFFLLSCICLLSFYFFLNYY